MPASSGHDPVAERSGDEPPPVGPPAWAVAADVLTLVLLASALFVVVAGRGLLLAFGQFVLPSAAFFLFLALATLGIRHVAHPTPGIRATFARWREWLNARPPVAAALRAFLVTRPLVFFVAYFAVVTFGFPKTAAFSLSSDPLGNLPARFDAGWYGGIALDGYEWDHQFGRQRNIAFFPALPMLMRPAGAFIGMNQSALPRDKRMLRALWAGVFVSLIAFGFALYYVARLGQLLTDQHGGAMAPLLLATYPFAVFFNAPYTESLFLLGSVGAFYYFHRGQWIAAALFGLLVGFSRPNGCLVSIPLGVLAIEPAVRAHARWRKSVGVASPGGDSPARGIDARCRDAAVHRVPLSPDRGVARLGTNARCLGAKVGNRPARAGVGMADDRGVHARLPGSPV